MWHWLRGLASGRACASSRRPAAAPLALEHNGDVYQCDHFVEPQHRLGNLVDIILLADLVVGEQQRSFGLAKRYAAAVLSDRPVRFICNGGCPKDRFIETPTGEPGLNFLCAGFKASSRTLTRPCASWQSSCVHSARHPPTSCSSCGSATPSWNAVRPGRAQTILAPAAAASSSRNVTAVAAYGPGEQSTGVIPTARMLAKVAR
ncbi:MAG: SPASM domain-containing protein [Chloroflexi bacterium]|nr:SPASM domain-containing protein [Chloroflexota bacterium]